MSVMSGEGAADKVRDAMAGITEVTETSTTTPPVVEPIVTEPVITEPVAVQPVATTDNPAWQEILNSVPEVLRDQLRPKLQEWDKNYQQSFDKYKPYEEFTQLDPGQLRAAKQLFDTLNTDPMRVYQSLQQHLNIEPPQTQPQEIEVEEGEEEELFDDPRLTELQQNQQKMMQFLQKQEEERVTEQADKWMEQRHAELTASFKAKGIEPDWEYILGTSGGLMQTGMEPDAALNKAAQNFESFVTKYRPSANSTAPLMMPPGNGTPATIPVKIAEMSDGDHKKLAAQMLSLAFKDT